MARGITRRLDAAISAVRAEILATSQRGKMAAAMATEGRAAGYLAALYDVRAMLTHGNAADPYGYWDEALQAEYARNAGSDLHSTVLEPARQHANGGEG